MADELPKDPREREIFLRALREYSESCEQPALIADCPFSVDTDDPRVRGCGEECMDLLGKYKAPRPSEEVALGHGFSIRRVRRPRARRLQRGAKPYDAREVYLQDQANGPPARWRLASILVGLIEAVETVPPADTSQAIKRMARIDELIRLAAGRGIDFETQVLPTLRRRIAVAVFTNLLLHQHGDTSFSSKSGSSWFSWVDSHLGVSASDQPSGVQGEHGALVLTSILQWAHTVDTQALLNWFPPDDSPSKTGPSGPADEDGVWIIERFTATYLHQWSEQSLRKEWLYLHGQHAPPCSPLEMSAREMSETDLAKQIAERFVEDSSSRQVTSAQLAHMLVEPAVSFLNEGRRVEASALFEAAVHHNPDSPDALNNLGFCLLPDDPERALEYLEKATQAGHGDRQLIDANRILVLTVLRRRTSALDLATTYLQQYEDSPPRPSDAWLWDMDSVLQGNDPELIETRDLSAYVATLLVS